MAEAGHGEHAGAHGKVHVQPTGEAGHGSGEKTSDPLHHIKDKVLLGLNRDGQWMWKPYGDHGHAHAGYVPQVVGPIKMEFTKHMFGTTVIAVLMFTVVVTVVRRILKSIQSDEAPKGPLANMVEALVVFVRDELVVPAGGKHLGHYTPLFLTYFFFILICNLAGMIPEAGGVTGNIAVTVALGGSVWVILMILGLVHQGVVPYFKNLVPPGTPWPMWPLMFFLELIGPMIKCFVLCVRLFANMIAGHLVVSNVLALGAIGKGAMMPVGLAALSLVIGVPLALGISGLEVLVCFIQAYVFTMLAVIFVGGAIHPEH